MNEVVQEKLENVMKNTLKKKKKGDDVKGAAASVWN
jgi:hypothetical protein